MKNLCILFVVIMGAIPLTGMQKKDVWVKTTDNVVSCIPSNIAQSSNLLKFLNTKHNGSESEPLIIPSSQPLSADLLHVYCINHGTKTKNLKLLPDDYYQLIDAAEKLKDPKRYISLIRKILPKEDEKSENTRNLSSHITQKWMGILIKTDAIKKNHTHHTCVTAWDPFHTDDPELIMSNNGNYFIHNIRYGFRNPEFKLYNTRNNKLEYEFSSEYRKPAYFSPANNYVITREHKGTYLYDIKTQKNHLLLDRNKTSLDMTMSDDGKYILNEERHPLAQSTAMYTLWKLDESNTPQKITLKNDLLGSYSVLFHPDNEHILHNHANLHFYEITTQANLNLTPKLKTNQKMFLAHHLTFSPDKTHILCDAWIDDSKDCQQRHALLNIQNLEQVIVKEIPAASPYPTTDPAPLCTARTHLITHICNEGKTLQLLDENMHLIASHTTQENSYISALAIDHTGDYLASGYSDGTIILWDISHPHKRIHGKKLVGSQGIIKKLTFTENHLLLSQSKFGEFWNTNNPCPTPGTAILWDTQGNQIINFGDSVLTSKISKNGKTVAVIDANLDWQEHALIPNWKIFLTLTCYNLDVPIKTYTLKQGYTLFEKYNIQKSSTS